MIESRADLRRYLDEDLKACAKGERIGRLELWLNPHRAPLRFQRRLRRAEYAINVRRGRIWAPLVWFARWRATRSGQRLGFTISPNVFGPGLSIRHWGSIVVNSGARVGANCRLQAGVCIGAGRRGEPLPVLGDDVYVGPGVTIIGGVQVGDRVTIGANSVVTHSLPSDCFAAGAPARVLIEDNEPDAPRTTPRGLLASFEDRPGGETSLGAA